MFSNFVYPLPKNQHILKNKIKKQLNLHVTDKNTIKHFSKYVDSLAGDKQSLKTFNSQLSNLQKYNII